MTVRGELFETLEGLFAGPADDRVTLAQLLEGLRGRSYAFAIAVLDFPNCLPTGIPWLSTITGVPMLILLAQYFAGRPTPSLPERLGGIGLPRGKLQHFLARARGPIRWLDNIMRPRQHWWVTGIMRQAMLVNWVLLTLLLALPIPFDNLVPAFAILFFCFAILENDGVMAILGWITTALTIVWTAFLLIAGHAAITLALAAARRAILGE
ncbi:MAG: exopolysaccharide biosynthesis protein [Alphaproteobacteria bacterium]|nr:exopolysaccharide biosynthesis protein [Alphaproteobacteria bacterium]